MNACSSPEAIFRPVAAKLQEVFQVIDMKPPKFFRYLVLPCLITGAQADAIYWDASNSTVVEVNPVTTPASFTATGSWGDVGNWSTGAATTTDPSGIPDGDDIATFNVSVTGGGIGPTISHVVTLGANQSAQGIEVISPNTINLTGGGTNRVLSLGSSGLKISEASTLNIGSGTSGQQVAIGLTQDQSWLFNSSNTTGIVVRNGVSWTGTAASGTLTLGGTNSNTSASSTISGVISNGAAGKTLNLVVNPSSGSNRWVLSGNNTYTGTTTISNGAVTLGNINALGASGTGSGTSVSGGGSIFMRSSIGSFAENLQIAGLGADSRGALRNVGGSNTWTGTIAADATANVAIGADGGTLTLSQTAVISTTGTAALQFVTAPGGTGTVIVNGNISGSASIAKIGAVGGILVLGGDAKTYTGETNVTTGVIRLNTALNGTSGIVVGASGILQGAGGSTVAPTTLNGTGYLSTTIATLAPGSGLGTVGTLNLGQVNFGQYSKMSVDVNFDASASSDLLITSGLNITPGAILEINRLGGSPVINSALLFIQHSGVWDGDHFTVDGSAVADDTTFTTGGNVYRIDYNYDGELGRGVALTLIEVVPEPGAISLIGVAAVASSFRRRRKSDFSGSI